MVTLTVSERTYVHSAQVCARVRMQHMHYVPPKQDITAAASVVGGVLDALVMRNVYGS